MMNERDRQMIDSLYPADKSTPPAGAAFQAVECWYFENLEHFNMPEIDETHPTTQTMIHLMFTWYLYMCDFDEEYMTENLAAGVAYEGTLYAALRTSAFG